VIEPLLSDETFLADLESVPRSSDRMDIWWLGQSGFLIQHGTRICVDPYLSDSLTKKYANSDKPHVRISRRVIDPARLDHVTIVVSTHGHTDHLDAETLNAIHSQYWNRWMMVIYPAAIENLVRERFTKQLPFTHPLDSGESTRIAGVEFVAIPARHDAPETDAQGRCRCLGYIIRGEFTIYHSGDGVMYSGLADRLRPFEVDVALLPINGKLQNMNGLEAARLAKEIGAKLVVPGHYDMFEFNTADPYAQFVPECERIGQHYRVLKLGERLTLPETSAS
jgi:L-ascorbate metabolism protein UlaG (beta-lactamase superfamily)